MTLMEKPPGFQHCSNTPATQTIRRRDGISTRLERAIPPDPIPDSNSDPISLRARGKKNPHARESRRGAFFCSLAPSLPVLLIFGVVVVAFPPEVVGGGFVNGRRN